MKKLLALSAVIILSVLSLTIVRTWLHQAGSQDQIPEQSAEATAGLDSTQLDIKAISQRLSEAIQIKTISYSREHKPGPEFNEFISWLKLNYAEVFAQLELTVLNDYTLLLRWEGQNSNSPVLLSAHYDVVPVIPGTAKLWQQPPFSGHIDSTHIWGRGALDDKSAVIALLEATSLMLKQGISPKRTVYLAFTHDEEIGSEKGSKAIAEYLQANNIKLAWSLDEGSFVLSDMIDGMPMPVASINVAEKGYLNIELSVQGEGGHSSVPPKQTAIGVLSQAVSRVQNSPMEGGLEGVSAEMFDVLSRYMPFRQRFFFANRWLFNSALEKQMSEVSFANAMLRTTTAPTMISGGVKENVLPIYTSANINFRLHPRDSVEKVVDHVQKVIDDPRVTIQSKEAQEASPVASTQSEGFKLLANASRENFGDVIVTPSITVGGTDSKYYQLVAKDSFRFNPMVIGKEDISGFHGNNERISIENMRLAVLFYARLIQSLEP